MTARWKPRPPFHNLQRQPEHPVKFVLFYKDCEFKYNIIISAVIFWDQTLHTTGHIRLVWLGLGLLVNDETIIEWK